MVGRRNLWGFEAIVLFPLGDSKSSRCVSRRLNPRKTARSHSGGYHLLVRCPGSQNECHVSLRFPPLANLRLLQFSRSTLVRACDFWDKIIGCDQIPCRTRLKVAAHRPQWILVHHRRRDALTVKDVSTVGSTQQSCTYQLGPGEGFLLQSRMIFLSRKHPYHQPVSGDNQRRVWLPRGSEITHCQPRWPNIFWGKAVEK